MEQEINHQTDVINETIGDFEKIIGSIEGIVPQIQAVTNDTGRVAYQKDEMVRRIESSSAVAQQIASSCEVVASHIKEIGENSAVVADAAHYLDQTSTDLKKRTEAFKI